MGAFGWNVLDIYASHRPCLCSEWSHTHSNDLTTAISDMETAYGDAAGRAVEGDKSEFGSGALGSDGFGDKQNPLQPGVYTFTVDVTIGSDLFLEGGPDDVFILRTAGSLKQVKSTKVVLVTQSDGTTRPLAKNIIWQVAGNVVIGAGAHMEGILLVKTDILFETGSSLDGRALAQTACNLQKATITEPFVTVIPAALDSTSEAAASTRSLLVGLTPMLVVGAMSLLLVVAL